MKSKLKPNYLLRSFLFLLGLVFLAAIISSIYQARATTNDLKAHPAPGQMVNVDGLMYHLNCLGTGSPTVILEAGLGESSLSWYPVQAEIAKTTRVCAYDRAGLGWSESTNKPMSPEQVATNLHTLLQNAGIAAPFILVGHSRGGVFVRSFYHLFQAEVQGMVLVDSTHENVGVRSHAYSGNAYETQKLLIAIAVPLSSLGVIRLAGLADADRQPSPLPADVLVAKTAVQNRTTTARATVNELVVARQSLDPQTPPPISLGDLPLVVLTSGKGVDVELARQEAEVDKTSVEDAVALAKLELELQKELAHLSTTIVRKNFKDSEDV
jgi:pimeloyl-ACP methyl ester carboxylesterase